MSLNLEDFKKTPTSSPAAPAKKPLDLSAFKVSEPAAATPTAPRVTSTPTPTPTPTTAPEKPKTSIFSRARKYFSDVKRGYEAQDTSFIVDVGDRVLGGKENAEILAGGLDVLADNDITWSEKGRAVFEGTKDFGKGGAAAGKDFVQIQIPRAVSVGVEMLADQILNPNTPQFHDERYLAKLKETNPERYRQLAGIEPKKPDENSLRYRSAKWMQDWANDVQTGLNIMQEERFAERGFDPNAPIFTPENFGYGLGQGASSIAAYAGITYVTKNPYAGAAVLGWLEGSETYEDAKQKLREDNPDMSEAEIVDKAASLAMIDVAGITLLEKLGMDALFKNYAGGIMRNATMGAITETLQESMQTIWSNAVEKYGYDETKGLTEDLAETIIITLPIGFFSGGAIRQGGDPALQTETLSRIDNSAAFPIDAAIEAGDVDGSTVYQNGTDGVLTEQFAQGRIDDVAQKVAKFNPELEKVYRDSVDPKNTTMDEIVNLGKELVSQGQSVDPTQITFEGDKTPREIAVDKVAEANPDVDREDIDELYDAVLDATQQEAEDFRNTLQENEKIPPVRAIQDMIDRSGESGAVIELSKNLSIDTARRLVEAAQQVPDQRPSRDLPTARELLDTSPADLQNTLESLDSQFRTSIEQLQREVDRLREEVRNSPRNSQVKIGKKKQLEATRAELRRAEERFNQQIDNNAVELRTNVQQFVREQSDLNRNEQEVLTDRVLDKIFRTGVRVPISSIIRNELRKYSPATRASEKEISNIIAGVTGDKKRQAKLYDELLEVLDNPDFAPLVADMTIEQVIEELVKKDGQFQVKNATRRPTGRAKFKNIHDEDLKILGNFVDRVRSDAEISSRLDTEMRRLAERYNVNTEQSLKQIALAWERLFTKNKMDERLDGLVIQEKEAKKKAEKKTTAKKVTKKKTKELPTDIRKQLEGLPWMKNVPVTMLDRITTPEGYEAFGRMLNGVVQFASDYHVTTIPHESFHVVTQMALNGDERQALYRLAREAYNNPQLTTDLAVEEQLAQDFAEWYVTEKNPANFKDRIIGYFRKIKALIVDMAKPSSHKKLTEIFKGIYDPQIITRVADANAAKQRAGFFQPRNFDKDKTLLAIHNLSAENLLKADEIGGLANPSMATIDPDILQFSGFGEITLIGDSQLITSSKAKTYAADAYSPRFPSTENTYDYGKAEDFRVKHSMANWDFDLEKFSYDAHRSRTLKELYLKKTGKLPQNWTRESYEDTVKMNELVQKNQEDFNNYLKWVRTEIGADNDRIFFGFTPAGNRRYRPLTAENASKYMNAQEGESMFYGLGSIRAAVTPNINTISKIKKAKDKLVSKEQFEKIKEEMSAEFEALMDELSSRHEDRRGYFDVADHIRDYYKNGREIFGEEYGYGYIPEEVFDRLEAFRTKLKEMPTEYFETKFKRVVDISEFHAAVVPDNTPKQVIDTLERYGITVTKYKNEDAGTVESERKTEENRSKALKNAATNRDETLFFQRKKQLDPLYNVDQNTPLTTFQDFDDLSVVHLKQLEGKTTVSKQFLLDTSNRPELKQPERDLIRAVVDEMEGNKINVQEYADRIKARLLPLESYDLMRDGDMGDMAYGYRYENIALPDEIRGEIDNYAEHIYNSPIQNSAGGVHFGDDFPNYFAHTRIEDMADGKTRRVIEAQSDLFQKGRLESSVGQENLSFREMSSRLENVMDRANLNQQERDIFEYHTTRNTPNPPESFAKVREKMQKVWNENESLRQGEIRKLQPYRNTWWGRIIREEVRQAGIDGKTKLQFPTGETAMKIEGLGDSTVWQDGVFGSGGNLTKDQLTVGREIYQQGHGNNWIITEVLEDGKFRAVPKSRYEYNPDTWQGTKAEHDEMIEAYSEQFDISGKVDTSNPIFRFYEKDVQKYLVKNYNAKRVTDEQGVSWIEFEVKPEVAEQPIFAFYQIKDSDDQKRYEAQQESSIFSRLHEQLEMVLFEIERSFELAEAGYRIKDADGEYRAVPSTFPEWIPEVSEGGRKLRSRQLMDRVLKQYLEGTPPKGKAQAELYSIIEERVLDQLPTELADEKILSDYIAEQMKVADQLRRDALSLLLRVVESRDGKLAKGKVKQTIRINTGQIRTDTREFSKKMKERARFFNRGYKTGYKQAASDKFQELLQKRKAKRDRKTKIEKVKSIYRRVRQATRTGAYLPIEYQSRLMDLFEDFDMTTMSDKTGERLAAMAQYFDSQEGEVPKHIAEKLKRLEKFPIGKMSEEQLTEFVETVTRIFEQGVLKKKLQDRKGEREFGDLVQDVVSTTQTTGRSQLNLSTFDPTRFADMLDGNTGTYAGGNSRLVEQLRVAMDESDQESSAILAEALEEIAAYGNEFSEEEMARIMHRSALEQDGQDQAEALEMQYPDFDFKKPLSEKERATLEVMVETFKEIRPEIAATYEAINNIPFPDNDRYFPFKYDKEVEKFDITDADFFDFKPTKTPQGFTMTRQEGVNRVLDIDIFKTFATQVQAQLYYAKVQPALNTAKDVVNSSPYQSRISVADQNYWKQFFADVASRGRRSGVKANDLLDLKSNTVRGWVANNLFDPSTIRMNINTAILGYKLSTVLIQPTALLDGMMNIRKRFGTVTALKVLPQFMRMMFSPNAVRLVQEQSVSLANRAGGQIELKEMQDAQRGQFNPSTWRKGYRKWQEYAYAGIRFTDLRTAGAVYEVMRNEYQKQGLSTEQAIREAERMMSLSQSSANVANRPQALNSEAMRFILPFQTFVFNAFNNVRYDAISTELKARGNVRGTVHAIANLQFIVYAIAAEAGLRELYSKIFGYEDDEDEEQTLFGKWFVSALGRLPFTSYFITYVGEFDGKINFSESLPVVQSYERILTALNDLGEGDADIKDAYNATRGILTLFGVAGTQQLHQILTAPDILGLGSVGMDLGIAWDDRTLDEKRADAIETRMANEQPIAESEIETIAAQVYGKNYEEKGVSYRTEKNAEVIREIAIRGKWGFDDGFVNVNMSKKSNDDVKAYVATNDVDLKAYRRPIKMYGMESTLMSDVLYKQLQYIQRASEADKVKIAALAAAETDEERLAAIDGDRDFAKRAYANYKLIDKVFYESL